MHMNVQNPNKLRIWKPYKYETDEWLSSASRLLLTYLFSGLISIYIHYKEFHRTLCWACDYLTMLRWKLIHVNIRHHSLYGASCWWLCVILWDSHKYWDQYPDNNIHGANMGPTWVLLAAAGPQVGPMNLVIRVHIKHMGPVVVVCVYIMVW